MSEKKKNGPFRTIIRPELEWPLKQAAADAKISAAEFVNRAIERAIGLAGSPIPSAAGTPNKEDTTT